MKYYKRTGKILSSYNMPLFYLNVINQLYRDSVIVKFDVEASTIADVLKSISKITVNSDGALNFIFKMLYPMSSLTILLLYDEIITF